MPTPEAVAKARARDARSTAQQLIKDCPRWPRDGSLQEGQLLSRITAALTDATDLQVAKPQWDELESAIAQLGLPGVWRSAVFEVLRKFRERDHTQIESLKARLAEKDAEIERIVSIVTNKHAAMDALNAEAAQPLAQVLAKINT